jgi:hypothetical protein
MPYDYKQWRRRIAERSDLTTGLVHLTRENSTADFIDVLLTILQERRIRGSTTEKGFIVGSTPAVCFQDAPLHGVCQNVWFEQKKQEADKNAKIRYRALGLWFPKPYIYRKGGRPAIYDKTAEAKQYLPREQWWRIVNFDLSSDANFIDWSHEREWRVPNDFDFDLEEATVLVIRKETYRTFVERAEARDQKLLKKIAGVVNLTPVLF